MNTPQNANDDAVGGSGLNAGLDEPRGCPTPGACSAVAEITRLRATLQGIVDADWRKWEELAQPEEFVRWAKCRANYALTYVGSNVELRGAHEKL
jgi:hypothetical protein